MKREMKTKASKKGNPHRGSSFADFLEDQCVAPEVNVLALKRVLSLQLQEIIETEKVSKTELAERMHTSRAAVDRLLDPSNSSLTFASVGKAAAALGRKVEVRFVSA
jgi:predicted XRE-type DNA-binding protein